MRRFALSFVELQLAMSLGALVCLVVGGGLRASPAFAPVYHPGSALYFAGDVFFLTVPVVAWMLHRGRGRRRSLALAAAMLAPVVAALVVGALGRTDALGWLVVGMYPLMTVGMLAYMLPNADLFITGPQRVRTLAR